MEKFRIAIEEEEVKVPADNDEFLAHISSSQQAQLDTHHIS
jgi:hypothetical protein